MVEPTPPNGPVFQRSESTSQGTPNYRRVVKKNAARVIWWWVTIIMGVIVAFNVLFAAALLRQPDARTEMCTGMSEWSCDIAVDAAVALNITFAIGAGVCGLIALALWRTRDIYKEVVEPAYPQFVAADPATTQPEPSGLERTEPAPTSESTGVDPDRLELLGYIVENGHVLFRDLRTYRLVTPVVRLTGFVIDLLATGIVTMILFGSLSDLTYLGVSWLVGITYWSVCHTVSGKTIGKWIVGARVVATATGQPPTIGRSITRSITLSLFAPLVALPMLWKESRRGWHDDKGGTVVINDRYGG